MTHEKRQTVWFLAIPIRSMGLVYLPTFPVKINHSWIVKYTSPMDPSWARLYTVSFAYVSIENHRNLQ